MHTFPLWTQIAALFLLIFLSAFFSISETALLAANRHRIRHLAKRGSRMAAITLWLIERIDKILSLILIANTLINALVTALITSTAISLFGNSDHVISLATGFVAFLLIIFAEIFPKVVGATYPERIILPASIILRPLMVLTKPAIWFVNLFISGLLKLCRIPTGAQAESQRLSQEELRSIVLEGSNFIPQKHRSIMLNLFDLEGISVEDIMTPRAHIEALNLRASLEDIRLQITTCYHNKLPVYEGEINQILGILHVRKAVALLTQHKELEMEHIRQLLSPAYFIPQDIGVFAQLQFFQENRERLGIIVDEYGEVQGLVTLEDIIEEMIGEFTTTIFNLSRNEMQGWDASGVGVLEGTVSLRDINKRFNLHFPLDGPKTLNGFLLEFLQDIPDAPVCVKFSFCVIEIIQVQHQMIKMVKLIRFQK